jgi:hypothetical protein
MKTNRQAHEEAAGMGLDDAFFRMNNIDPDAEYVDKAVMFESARAEIMEKIRSAFGSPTSEETPQPAASIYEGSGASFQVMLFPPHISVNWTGRGEQVEISVMQADLRIRERHYAVVPNYDELALGAFVRRLTRLVIAAAYNTGVENTRKQIREAIGVMA